MTASVEVAVIGGGASGMAAAISAAEQGIHTVLLERNPMLGRKLSATGNGRCNLMNIGQPSYYGDTGFARKVIEQCGIQEQRAFWHRYGLMLKEESQGRIYPMTLQASSVLEALKTGLRMNRADIRLGADVTSVIPEKDSGFAIRFRDGESIRAEKVILSAGGAAQPKLGGTEKGYALLEKLGHEMIPIHPSLCGIKTDQRSISGLNGIRVQGTVTVLRGEKPLHRETGEILFTEEGISGICVMQCSRFIHSDGADCAEIDLAPEELKEDGRLQKELMYRKERFASEPPEMLLSGIVPQKLSYAVCKQAGFSLRGECLGNITAEDVQKAACRLRHYQLRITGDKGMESAQVTAGGADCAGFSPDSMESRLHPGLYAAGEVLNVDGDCGGFNLMFAFGSGMIAGRSAAQR